VKDGTGIIKSRNKWVAADGAVQLTDDTTVRNQGHAGSADPGL
jgi:hypothetical protein